MVFVQNVIMIIVMYFFILSVQEEIKTFYNIIMNKI